MMNDQSSTSWHYTVDDKEIYHHIPDDEVAWHAGDRETPDGGNMNGVGIELCVNADGNFDRTLENGAKLTAYLLKAYSLTTDDIKQHNAFTGKDCPQTIRNENRMQEFLNKVRQYMDS